MNRQEASTRYSAYVSVILTAAIFGFFYAWVCSTMWGSMLPTHASRSPPCRR
jgi:hypothetical protein